MLKTWIGRFDAMVDAWTRASTRLSATLAKPRPRNRAVLVGGCLVIALWQFQLALNPQLLDQQYQVTGAIGLAEQRPLTYFLFYLNRYPVAANPMLYKPGREAAQRLVTEQGHELKMEWGNPLFSSVRLGDHARIFLYLPDLWLRRDIILPSVIPANGFFFIMSLWMVFAAFWWLDQVWVGALLVALFGSNPFQLHATYGQENIFGWSIVTALMVLALHLPLMGARRTSVRYAWAAPVVTGIIVGTIRHIRAEGVMMMVSPLICYLLFREFPFRKRMLLGVALIASFFATSAAWSGYFHYKIDQAKAFVVAHGGAPHPVPPEMFHNVWLPIWDGLGDFDTKYGHEWNDRKAHAIVKRVVFEKYGYVFPRWDPNSYFFEDSYWDAAHKYPRIPLEVPHYHEIVRDAVLKDISNDPAWFIDILLKRVKRVFEETTPIELRFYRWTKTFPLSATALLPLLALAVCLRQRFIFLLLIFTLPVSLPIVLIFSGKGMTWYTCFHLVCAAVLIGFPVQLVAWRMRDYRFPKLLFPRRSY